MRGEGCIWLLKGDSILSAATEVIISSFIKILANSQFIYGVSRGNRVLILFCADNGSRICWGTEQRRIVPAFAGGIRLIKSLLAL